MSDSLQSLSRRVTGQGRALAALSGAHVHNSAAQSINTATFTALTFDTEDWDDDAYHDTGANTSRITIRVPGRYAIGCNVGFAANATGYRQVRLFVNGATSIKMVAHSAAAGGTTHHEALEAVYEFNAGDYIEVLVYQNSGGALNVDAADVAQSFWIYKLSG